MYLSQDPIGLAGNNPTLYGYVKDTNTWVDEFGLDCIKNKVDGTARENKVRAKLNALFGKDNVLSERTLRDSSGKKVVGADGTGRRIDFIVLDGNGKAKYSVEVTSKTAPKTDQIIKETQIKDAGGTFIRNPNTKEMVDVSNVPTRIIRL